MTTRTPSTQVRWRVQVRKSRAHKWVNKGLFETRAVAREDAKQLRDGCIKSPLGWAGYGFGNTRVQRYQPGTGAAK